MSNKTTSSNFGMFPKQRLSLKEKTKNDNEYGRNMLDYLITFSHDMFKSSDDPSFMSFSDNMAANYNLMNNILNQKDFERDCNLLGIDVGQIQDTIKPYNKTPNKIQVLLGEELKRPSNTRAVLVNNSGIQSKLEHRNQLLRDYVVNMVQFEIEKQRTAIENPELPEEQVEAIVREKVDTVLDPEQIDKYMATSYIEAREIMANKIIQYLKKEQSIIEKKNDAFKHGLLSGIECGWVGIESDKPVVYPVNSKSVFYHRSAETKYIQDSLYAGQMKMMTTGDILDKFGQFLKEDDLGKLEGTLASVHGADKNLIGKKMVYHNDDIFQKMERNYFNSSTHGSYGRSNTQHDMPVYHVEWVSQKKVGFLTTIDSEGEVEELMVSENFPIPSYATKTTKTGKYGKKITEWSWTEEAITGANIEELIYTLMWEWIPEVWSGIRIGEDIYCCIGPKDVQFRSLDNPRDVKLGYHGVVYSAMNADPISLMDRMKHFQYLYFILVHKLKQLIAKDKGMVFHFDTSMIPESLGFEKALYYLDQLDIDFFDPLRHAEEAGAAQRKGKMTGATSRSNMQHILNYISLMNAIDQEISDVAGVTRQREGQGSPTETVTNYRQAIQQSTHITEAVYFYPHDRLWEHIMQSLLHAAQIAWRGKNVTKQFVLDDFSIQTLNISSGMLDNVQFGLFTSNSAKESETFRALQELAQPLLQNDKAKYSDIVKMFKSDSIEELTKEIEHAEQRAEQLAQQQQEAQMQMAQEQLQAQKELQEDKQAHEKELKEMELENKLRVAEIQSFAFQRDQDLNDNKIPDQLEVEKLRVEKQLKNRELDIKEKELKLKKSQAKSE